MGTFADSEAVSSGPQARASRVAFPLIARIAGGSGWRVQVVALEGLCFQGAWDTQVQAYIVRGLPHPQSNDSQLWGQVRQGDWGGAWGGAEARNSSGGGLQGSLEECTTSSITPTGSQQAGFWCPDGRRVQIGEMGHCQEPAPGVRAMGTRASIWRTNPDQALCVWPLGDHLCPGLLSLGAGVPDSLETAFSWEHSQLCP